MPRSSRVRPRASFSVFVLILACCGALAALGPAGAAGESCSLDRPQPDTGRLPLVFVANYGQSPDEVLYVGHAPGTATVRVHRSGRTILDLAPVEGLPAASLTLRWPGAGVPVVEAREPQSTLVGYAGAGESGGLYDLSSFGALAFHELYPGIGARVAGGGRNVDFVFRIAPGADPDAVRWDLGVSPDGEPPAQTVLDGARLHVDLATTPTRRLTLEPLTAWQHLPERTAVAASYRAGGAGLEIGEYDVGRELFVRLRVLHSPFYAPDAAIRDGHGGVLMAGAVLSAAARPGDLDGYVARLDPGARTLSSLTFFDGGGDERITALALAGGGRVWAAGRRSSAPAASFLVPYDLDERVAGPVEALPHLESVDGLLADESGLWVVGPGSQPDKSLRLAAPAGVSLVLPRSAGAPLRPHLVGRWRPHDPGAARFVAFEAPRLHQGLRMWRDCQGSGELLVGVPAQPLLHAKAAPCEAMRQAIGAKAAPCGSRFLETYGISLQGGYAGSPRIDEGWGFHALRWKEMQSGASYNPGAASPPTAYIDGPAGSSAASALNGQEANSSVFPGGDPGGSWFGREAGTFVELAIGAAVAIDRYDTPVYANLPHLFDDGSVVAIKSVTVSVEQSLSTMCTNWDDDLSPDPGLQYEDEDVVAATCTLEHGDKFLFQHVIADWWGSSGLVTDEKLEGQDLNSGFGLGSRPWVADPVDPRTAARGVRQIQEIARQLRDRAYVLMPAEALAVKPLGQAGPAAKVAAGFGAGWVAVRAIDLEAGAPERSSLKPVGVQHP